MVIGYLLGTFDLLNVGDLDVLAQARLRCSHLVVGVHTDDAVAAVAGRPPVVPLNERLALLSHVRGVDQVVVHEQSATAATADVVLTVDGEGLLPAAEVLSPRRCSASATLRRALDPLTVDRGVRSEDVA
ncbi:adenylyltransferase/cytidyltransferase family protein [uncultured Friedmanniella sp.]|uniref:adenylyltransferase/cytidyltransferase family protein n=1 Tax=uncultured Friedmanniella sp. TaxID=335381 RepID=UPI0035CAE985